MIRQPDLARAERMAYELLLLAGRIPVCPLTLLKSQRDVSVHTYMEVAELIGKPLDAFEREHAAVDAFTFRAGNRWVVAYRSDGNPARRRFTLAHELGHIVLAHPAMDAAAEREADHFASCLLCPAPVLKEMPEKIAVKCFVSVAAARMAQRRRGYVEDEALLKRVENITKANDADGETPEKILNNEQKWTYVDKGTQV